ncbi:MAG: hypothetical protein HOQ27_05435 [Dermatophilaceae bacterium]|nr:hypothetical protein [Dermatophilaceae bacterium]NUR16133.1 hypothetical protein [Dermatophilaceae bacterium]NUR81619.1 hypothetical protein [Dermatophilaceae bacterium]
MLFLVISMLVVTVLAVAVVGVVAVPAHRGGRDVLTAKGEAIAEDALRRAGGVVRRTDARMP